MFRSRSNAARIDIAEGLGRPHYRNFGLEEQFVNAVSAVAYCLKIRNQYAHCLWHDDNSGRLGFTNLEVLADSNDVVQDLRGARILYVDPKLLKRQLGYFEYADTLLNWTNFEGRLRIGKVKVNRYGKEPAAMERPPPSI